jgi:hypothetical protein
MARVCVLWVGGVVVVGRPAPPQGGDELVAQHFGVQPDELARVSGGLRDVESRLTAAVSGLWSQLGAGGSPWQFSGGPAGVEANVENAQSSVDPSATGAVTGLADYLLKIVNTFQHADG